MALSRILRQNFLKIQILGKMIVIEGPNLGHKKLIIIWKEGASGNKWNPDVQRMNVNPK